MKKSSAIKWDLIVNERVGPIKLNTPVDDYKAVFDLNMLRAENLEGDEPGRYENDDIGIIISTEHGKVITIECEEELIYKGKNLINMSEKDVVSHLGQEPDEIDGPYALQNGRIISPWDFDELGLLIWMEDGTVSGVTVTDSTDDDEPV